MDKLKKSEETHPTPTNTPTTTNHHKWNANFTVSPILFKLLLLKIDVFFDMIWWHDKDYNHEVGGKNHLKRLTGDDREYFKT